MLNTITVTARDILRNYKEVFDKVKKTKQPAVVVSQKEPQVGIISLDDLKRLEELDNQMKYQASTQSLLETAGKVRKVLKDKNLPKDLSTNHDYYHYEKADSK